MVINSMSLLQYYFSIKCLYCSITSQLNVFIAVLLLKLNVFIAVLLLA